MPQLPSGRHVGLQFQPLTDLLREAGNPANVHRIMALTTASSLAPYARIILLIPTDDPESVAADDQFMESSVPRPPGLTVKDSGYVLAQLETLSADWSTEDKLAFQAFLDQRCPALFASVLSDVERVRQWLLKESGGMTRMLALSFQAGCHPCQENGWKESNPGGPDWDSYDMLAALGQLARLLPPQHEVIHRLGTAYDRLQGVWATLSGTYPIPAGWPEIDKDVRDCAASARAGGWLAPLPEVRQQWLHEQCVIECVNLWNAWGESFQNEFPRQYGIIELVVTSPAADSCFEAAAHNERQ